ncbi:MAG: type II secretion system minor pseudopilin GspI, partial [Burkholderiaceae bacterium]|nr:type II secretion system minor pseudopilin GspI [Burkholderiaceae bacterium]
RRSAQGFTLLEVLVALIIVATALGASMRAVGSLSNNSAGLRSNMMATWSAENRLTQIRLASQFPDLGETTFDCPQGDLKLVCKQVVLATPNPMFRRVQVSVYEESEPSRQIIKLTQLVPR